MKRLNLRATILSVLALTAAAGSARGSVLFVGSDQNINPPAQPGGRCAPALTVSIGPGSASGLSNLGAFTPTQSHCLSAPPPTAYFGGLFDFAFSETDHLFGTYTGTLSASGTPGLFDNLQNFTVTGGAGRFLAAVGDFTGTGTVQFLPGGLAEGRLTFEGVIDAPGVPEPATWLTLILGIAAAGACLRRRRLAACR